MAGIYVETTVRVELDEVWRVTQDPESHVRWDLRFTQIVPTSRDADGRWTFRYSLRLLGIDVHGTGVSIGETARPDGTRTSALRFESSHPLSPLRSGSGYWRYVPGEVGTRFVTGFDYEPGWGALGRAVDPWALRPLTGWLTALSFDTLRLWLETGARPEVTRRRGAADLAARVLLVAAVAGAVLGSGAGRRGAAGAGVAAVVAGVVAGVVAARVPTPSGVPRAGRCRRKPDRVLGRPPVTLAGLRLAARSAS